MCGIFGYVGSRTDAGSLVVEGLKCLEYRGYDSWGVACKDGSSVNVQKETGKISDVSTESFDDTCTLAMGHTRWATHGGVTKENAHPHTTADGRITVVHNGIIENYQELKADLIRKGHVFLSETDSEVVPHLIEEELKITSDFAHAVRNACSKFTGRYGIVAMDTESNKIVAARTGSTLIV